MLDIEDFKKKLDKKSRLMGIDPGGKRVGIAISDENKIVATPYTTIIKNKYSDFIKEIKKIVDENQIKGIVIGNPINMDGSPSQSSQSAKDLAINLSRDVAVNITLWDERLSTSAAEKILISADVSREKRNGKIISRIKYLDKSLIVEITILVLIIRYQLRNCFT